MLGNRKLIVDAFCEVREFTKHCQDGEFYDFSKHEIVPDAVYVISRQQFKQHVSLITQLAQNQTILPVLGNPAEGSETLFNQAQALGILDLVRQGRILIITGGHLPDDIPSLYYENFLPKILDYKENLKAVHEYKNNWTDQRPYKFLFLNGRSRPHRSQLMSGLQPVLDQAIWSNLDSASGPIKYLQPEYEFDFYQKNTNATQQGFVKNTLFDNTWGEIYLNAKPYSDTYFSLVTETVFDYPYSFRTEKIWKPIAIGHPFIAVANRGYYGDLHQLGFQTFGHLIDESFDQIDNNRDRLERIQQIVIDLCQQDLASFVRECYNVCKYNQQQLAELGPKIRAEFPNRFEQYINERS